MPSITLGSVYCTKAASQAFSSHAALDEVRACLKRHAACDFGIASEDSKAANLEAIETKERVFSAYKINNIDIWVITDAGHDVTTVLLPSDY